MNDSTDRRGPRLVPQIESGEGKVTELPQWLVDRFGWEELPDDVAAAVETVDPDERDRMIILVPTYGHAGAIERTIRASRQGESGGHVPSES